VTATIASSSKATPSTTFSRRDQRLAPTELAESSQVPLAEAAANLSSLAERGVCAGGVAVANVLQSSRQ
jgi:hypothetical protein